MKSAVIAFTLPLAAFGSGTAFAVSTNTSPGYSPPQIQAPPQFNGGVTTTAPRAAPIQNGPAAPVVVPRRR